MLILLGMTLLAAGGYVCVGRYERNLAAKAGPWITTMLRDSADHRTQR